MPKREFDAGPMTNDITHPKVRFEGGACVMTEVGDGMVGWRASKPKCSGREPGRTMAGVGAEFLGGMSWEISVGYTGKETSCWFIQKWHLLITFPVTIGSWLLSDIPDIDSGLPGGEESTSTGASSSFTFTSDGVCRLMSKATELAAGSWTKDNINLFQEQTAIYQDNTTVPIFISTLSYFNIVIFTSCSNCWNSHLVLGVQGRNFKL